MDSGPSIMTNIVVIIIILLLAVLFTLTEYSLVKVRPSALRALQEARKRPSKNLTHAINMTHHMTEYLSTAQVGITLTSLILGWLGEAFIASLIISSGVLPPAIAHSVASIAAILIFTFIHAVFTDLVPKNIAIDQPVKVLLFIVRPVMFFHIVLYPLIWLFDRTAAGVTKLLGFNAHPDEDIYSENEILSLSKDAADAGEIDEEDLTFMKRAFEMNDKVAVDIMIDRTQLTVVNVTDTIGDALNLYLEEKFSRMPVVADNDKDKILGYVFSYDLVRQGRLSMNASVRTVLRNLPVVSENQPITEVLQEMIEHRAPIVVVKDEYGGTSGIVTDKDVYEELFGTVRDEIDDVSDDLIQKLGSDEDGNMHYKVSGKMTLYDFERFFKTEIKSFEDSEMVTLTGYVLDDHPDFQVGEAIKINNFEITALDFKDAYIEEFEVVALPEAEVADASNEDQQNN
ncbi:MULTISPECIES: hemolysin family protein [Weissella]|uniref:CorC_2 protein n=2 Tax=Weissella cibaria TaxID=137591 RepID=A0A0D1LMJ7_9LACO|nr:hemolysin family protein [Weissella cibaria]ALI32264.1 hemolysin [Weissella cibaria]AVO66851.1 HlyC/CorC family transporter [Weissella cibaria]KIU19922.1 Magnesium and cobalt efflux protein CorC [Weissella cibaria]MBD1502890.1 HlyC/CorC family transporter [Weissella cibaria]MBU7562329.1 HlyC/CorC family transporter [Weissella cibaria]